jgi:AcrR family transcriptional regulator
MARGRPRQFDTERALDAAMHLFWRHGYEGTSLAALTEEMGINVPSLYAAFGNKEALFARVIDRYLEKPGAYLGQALAAPTARRTAEIALEGAINMVLTSHESDGCLLVHGALSSSPSSESVRRSLAKRRAAAEAAVQARFERAVAEGDLPPDANAAQLARFIMTVIWGIAVQASGGATREQLEEVAATALRAWPQPTTDAP